MDEENDPSTTSGTSPLYAPVDSLRVVVVALDKIKYLLFILFWLFNHPPPSHHNRGLQCFKLMQRRIILIFVLNISFLAKFVNKICSHLRVKYAKVLL